MAMTTIAVGTHMAYAIGMALPQFLAFWFVHFLSKLFQPYTNRRWLSFLITSIYFLLFTSSPSAFSFIWRNENVRFYLLLLFSCSGCLLCTVGMLLLSHCYCYCYCYYFSSLFHIPFLYLFAFCVLSTSLFLSHRIVPLLSFLASSCVWTFSLPLSFDVYFLGGITLYCEQQQWQQQQLQTWISAISKVNTSTIY